MKTARDILKSKLNKIKEEDSLSAADIRLKRYLDLTAEMKKLEAELDIIREEIKHRGTFSTSHYVAVVSEVERTSAPSLKTLIEEFGPRVRELCSTTTYKTVKVTKKD